MDVITLGAPTCLFPLRATGGLCCRKALLRFKGKCNLCRLFKGITIKGSVMSNKAELAFFLLARAPALIAVGLGL